MNKHVALHYTACVVTATVDTRQLFCIFTSKYTYDSEKVSLFNIHMKYRQ